MMMRGSSILNYVITDDDNLTMYTHNVIKLMAINSQTSETQFELRPRVSEKRGREERRRDAIFIPLPRVLALLF